MADQNVEDKELQVAPDNISSETTPSPEGELAAGEAEGAELAAAGFPKGVTITKHPGNKASVTNHSGRQIQAKLRLAFAYDSACEVVNNNHRLTWTWKRGRYDGIINCG